MNIGMKDNNRRTLPKEMDELMDKMEKIRKEKEVSMQQVESGRANSNPLPINQITRDMLDPSIPFVASITVPVGFVPYASTNYITNYNFDTTDLAMYAVVPNIEYSNANSFSFLTLKGRLSYNINIESFRPVNPVISTQIEPITTFSKEGTVLVNKVITYGNILQPLPNAYMLTWKVESQYITSFDGISHYANSRKTKFYNLLNNSRIERTVNIPVVLQFVPVVNYTV